MCRRRKTHSGATVSVGAAAAAVCAVGVAGGTTKVLTAATIVPRRDVCGFSGDGLSRAVVATRQAASSAVALGGSAPSVRRAAGAAVDCAVGIAKQVTMGRAALAILGVLVLPLLRDSAEVRGRDLGVVTLNIRDTLAAFAAVLSGQAAVGGVDIAGRVDPAKVDVG